MPPRVQDIASLIEALRPMLARTFANTAKAEAPINSQLESLINARIATPAMQNPRMPIGAMTQMGAKADPQMTSDELRALIQYAHQAKPGSLQQMLGGNRIGLDQVKRYAGVPAYLLGLQQLLEDNSGSIRP